MQTEPQKPSMKTAPLEDKKKAKLSCQGLKDKYKNFKVARPGKATEELLLKESLFFNYKKRGYYP